MEKTKKIRISVVIILAFVLIISILFGMIEINFGNRLRSLYTARISAANSALLEVNCNGTYDLDDCLCSDKELTEYISESVLKGFPIDFNNVSFGCSTYSAANTDGDYVYGRNFDFAEAVPIVVRSVPNKGYKSVSLSNLRFFGIDSVDDSIDTKIFSLVAPFFPLDGINEKGLSICVNMLDGNPTKQNTGKSKISTTIAVRMILDKAATVEEAVNLLEQYDMQSSMYTPYHFLIADATGDSAVIEYKKDVLQVIRTKKNFQICTNFWESKHDEADYDFQCVRYKAIDDLLTASNGIVKDENDGMNILQAASQDTTRWSEFYNLNQQTMNIALNGNFDDVANYSIDKEVGNSYPYYAEIIVWVVLIALIIFLLTKVKRKQK